MRLGLVTYNWGKDWDLETLIKNCEATGFEVLPENPPGQAYLGDLHLLDFYGRVAARADTGLLLDCAHLAIYQRLRGLAPTTGLDGYPLDRVVELHVAGGSERRHGEFAWVDDDHTPEVLGYTMELTVDDGGGGYTLEAVPEVYGPDGRRSFYLDEKGVIRGADHQGGAPEATDPPVK